jgi:hypothetical protein
VDDALGIVELGPDRDDVVANLGDQPRRAMMAGADPSTCQAVVLPSPLVVRTKRYTCGFAHSYFVINPSSTTWVSRS